VVFVIAPGCKGEMGCNQRNNNDSNNDTNNDGAEASMA
jgi:hypothetical protein